MVAAEKFPGKRWDLLIIVSGIIIFIDIGFPLLGVPLWGVVLSVLVVIVAADSVTAFGVQQGLAQTPKALMEVLSSLAVAIGTFAGILLILATPLVALYLIVRLFLHHS